LEPILWLLEEKYGITEEDFFSAEIEVVPAGQAREAGLDRSMVLAYGQDDKVCAYGACRAFIEDETPQRTDCLLLVDKEEIGSVGATGMESGFFENMVAEVLSLMEKGKEAVWLSTRRCLSKSRMLSADVNSGFDPTFGDCFEGKNSSYLGRGMVLSKFSGSSGKSGGNDANPEFIAYLRRIFGDKRIMFQMAELGKVDLGGGGTIAYIPARYGMEVVDCGIAVLNMHAPWEAADKGDIYEMKRGMSAFLTAKNNH
jgi:aspartyl aminopeptidase